MPLRKESEADPSGQKRRKNPIDAVACVAALAWFGAALVLSWWRLDMPLLTSLAKALIGAIGVYVIVFFSIYFMVRVAGRRSLVRKEAKTENQ